MIGEHCKLVKGRCAEAIPCNKCKVYVRSRVVNHKITNWS